MGHCLRGCAKTPLNGTAMRNKPLIMLPTYNERANLEQMVERIRRLPMQFDILVVDDNSPDGTGEFAKTLADKDESIHAVVRASKLGIGSAHLDGIRWAYDQGYSTLVTMDCDLMHQPEDIPAFIEASSKYNIVISTRFLNPESLKDWNMLRRIVTQGAHLLTKIFLKIDYDLSGAFRLYRLDQIPRQLFDLVTFKGYGFFFQSLFICSLNGFTIKEIPVMLPARISGSSKMTVPEAVIGLSQLFITAADVTINRKRYVYQANKALAATDNGK